MLVDDPARVAGVGALGVDETAFLAATLNRYWVPGVSPVMVSVVAVELNVVVFTGFRPTYAVTT